MRQVVTACLLALLLPACGPSTRAADSTPIAALLPATLTSAPGAATPAISSTPTPAAINPDVLCVPPSLMMHSRDRFLLQRNVIPFLVEEHYTTLTYRDYLGILNGEKPMPPRPVILSIDDVSAEYINSYFTAMFDSLHSAGLTATIAMVTNQPPEKTDEHVQANWALVKQWSEWGMAVESHTVDHLYLPRASSQQVAFEVEESTRRIAVGVGDPPTALVLPYGEEDITANVEAFGLTDSVRKANLKFIVGIAGGRQIAANGGPPIPADQYPLYVGRVGANKDQPGETLWEIAHWYCSVPACAHLAPVDCSKPFATPLP